MGHLRHGIPPEILIQVSILPTQPRSPSAVTSKRGKMENIDGGRNSGGYLPHIHPPPGKGCMALDTGLVQDRIKPSATLCLNHINPYHVITGGYIPSSDPTWGQHDNRDNSLRN